MRFVTLAVKVYRIFFLNFKVKNHTVRSGLSGCFFNTPQSLVHTQKKSLLRPGSEFCELSLVKRKELCFRFLPLCCDRQSLPQFEIKGSVATGDRVESSHAWTQPCGMRLLTDPLHHLVSVAHWRTGCEERLMQARRPAARLVSSMSSSLLSCVWASGYTLLGFCQKGRRQN